MYQQSQRNYETPEEMISNAAKRFYLNEDASPKAFDAMDRVERSNALMEFGYASYKQTESAISFLRKRMAEATTATKNHEFMSMKLYKEIAATGGNITRLKEYTNCVLLMESVLQTNDSAHAVNASDRAKMLAASNKADRLLRALKTRASMAPTIGRLLRDEKMKRSTIRIFENYFVMTTLYLFAICDSFYGAAIRASMDYSVKPPVVNQTYFVLEDHVMDVENTIIEAILNEPKTMRNGMKPLTESFAQVDERIELQEGVFDVLFTLASENRLLDATLLLPIYIVRMLIYGFFYAKETIANLSDSLERSVNLRRINKMTAAEFDAFKRDAGDTQLSVNQSLHRAEATIRHELESDRSILASSGGKGADTMFA